MGGADDGNRHKPEPFLDVRVHDLSLSPGLTGLCVGYELGKWRAEQLVEHAMDWLPEFALTYTEPAPGKLIVEGTLEGKAVKITLQRRDESSFFLLSRGFHWINEQPINR